MKENSPVFIIGPSRSGTSLLYRILQKHSVFRPENCPAGVDLTESKVFIAPGAVFDKRRTHGLGAYAYMLFNDSMFNEFLSKLHWTVRWQKMLGTSVLPGEYNYFTRRLMDYRATRIMFWKFYQGPTMVRGFFELAMKARGVERVLEKTPQHLHRIPEIRHTYPDCRLIGIIRHPIDTFTSYRRRYEVEHDRGVSDDQLAWLEITPEQFCAGFKIEESIVRRENARHDGSFMSIRYEDFTNDPQETLKQILFFLGERYEEQCVVGDETDKAYWDVDPYLFADIRRKTKDWREYINQEEAEHIEATLKQSMERLGYERYT